MTEAEQVVLSARGLEKTYVMRHKTVSVLRGAELCVASGETVAIVGISGSGKSTLLHILGGLGRPDKGIVTLGESDLYELSEARRSNMRAEKVGFVFQSYHLLPEMSVLENVMLPAMVRRRFRGSGKGMREQAMRLLTAVGIENRSAHMPQELSGGEQQRVALARALTNGPDIVFADEPTGNLDEGTGSQILKYLFSMTRERGRSLVLVTHNTAIAEQCDRVLHLEEGLLVQH